MIRALPESISAIMYHEKKRGETMDKRLIENERVKNSIETAVFTLLNDTPFSEVTVSDIVRVSGVAKASYYRNFASKENIIEQYMERQRKEVADRISFSHSVTDIFNEEKLTTALAYYLQQKDYLLLLYDHGFGTFLLEDMNQFAELSIGDMPQASIERYRLYFLSGAMYNTTMQWLKNGAKESPQQMARAFIEMLSTNDLYRDK